MSGATGQAIRVANHYNIPVFNLKNVVDNTLLSRVILDIIRG